jgi:Type IV secretion-system coupling protein DNA-binding domain
MAKHRLSRSFKSAYFWYQERSSNHLFNQALLAGAIALFSLLLTLLAQDPFAEIPLPKAGTEKYHEAAGTVFCVSIVGIIALVLVYRLFEGWFGKLKIWEILFCIAVVVWEFLGIFDSRIILCGKDPSCPGWMMNSTQTVRQNSWLAYLFPAAMLWLVHAYRLLFVFRNRAVRLTQFWLVVATNMVLIAVAYRLAILLGLWVSLLLPPRFLDGWLKSRSLKPKQERGSKLNPLKEVQREFDRSLIKNPCLTVPFNGTNLPVSYLVNGGIAAIGSAGAGKTTVLNLVADPCLVDVYQGSGKRAILNDPKGNILSTLASMATGAEIVTLNPLDKRSPALDLARDITSVIEAQDLAAKLMGGALREKNTGERFFAEAGQLVLTGVIENYNDIAPKRWELRDLLLTCQSEKILRAIVGANPKTAGCLGAMGTDRTAASVMATMLAELSKFNAIAAIWHRKTKKFSIKHDFMQDGHVLVLGNPAQAQVTTAALNSFIMNIASQLLMGEPDTFEPRTYLFFDEFQDFKMDHWERLFTQGRSKGIVLLIAFQSKASLDEAFGRDKANAMLEQITTKWVGRLNDQGTAEFLSKSFGETEESAIGANYNWQKVAGGIFGMGHVTMQGAREERRVRPLVMPSEFTVIPPVDPGKGVGITAYSKCGHLAWKHYEPWHKLEPKLIARDAEVADFIPVPDEWQRLKPWDEEDWRRLGIYDIMKRLENDRNDTPEAIPRKRPPFSPFALHEAMNAEDNANGDRRSPGR